MKNLITFFLFLGFLSLQSCSKDNVGAGGSRKVKYEITGNYSGEILVAVVVANNSSELVEITKLPWSLEFTAESSVKIITLVGSGSGGSPGQKATAKIFVGDKEVSKGEGTALSSGIISLNPSYITL